MENTFTVVGKRMPDVAGVDKVTGAAKFISDITLPGMLIGKVLHSPHAHARVVSIDTSRAERLPGVIAALTPKDVPQKQYTARLMNFFTLTGIDVTAVHDTYVLNNKLRFAGDAVAAVAALNEKVAEEAVELIKVKYELLPAVFNEMEAMKEDAPQIHDFVHRWQAGKPAREAVQRNIGLHLAHVPVGDVEKGFRESDYILEESAYSSKQKQSPIETYHCIASFDAGGRLTLWSQSQFPHVTRRMIAYIFDIPVGMITVKAEHIGGAFGVNICGFKDPLCVALAKKAGKPVKLVYSRQEEFIERPTRSHFGPYTLKMGVKRDGSIAAQERKVISRAGAYFETAAAEAMVATAATNRLYRRQSYKSDIDVVYTNKVPCGSMRGFGNPEETFIREQMMDQAAEKLGTDPLEFRLKNLTQVGDPVYSRINFTVSSSAMAECIRLGAEKIGWKNRKSKQSEGTVRRGIGVSCMAHDSGAWPVYIEPSNALVKFNEDGTVVLSVAAPPLGTHIYSSLAQIVAEVLGLSFWDIHVVWGNTDVTLWETGSHASRTMYVLGNAVQRAAGEARTKLLSRAAKKLGAVPEELDLKDKRIFVKAQPDKGVSIADIAREATYTAANEEAITGICRFVPANSPPSYQALFTEVEVDTETGEVSVVRAVMAMDCGRAINPMTVEGQLEGGMAQGLGFALWEEPVMDARTGVVMTDDFDTYKIASTLDMPDLEVMLTEQPDPTGPFGAKGVGEPGCINVAASVANAIYNAVGIRIWELPITPEKVLRALKVKR
ncbi:MAG: molybdopterin-dependent oxidoreductase [Dehalococcoidia bacterium]|nr:molybdopterin-dependent oxidoreductase [Dehalococcoidia bacterium]